MMENIQISNLINLAFIVLTIGYVVYLQVALRTVKASKYIITPIILMALFINSVKELSASNSISIAPLLVLMVIGIISGVISGIITKVFVGEDNRLYQHGGWKVFVFLLIIIPVRIIIRRTLSIQPGYEILQNIGISYLTLISFQLLSRSLVVIAKFPNIFSVFVEQRRARRGRRENRRINRRSRKAYQY